MLKKESYPILEFDDEREALISPEAFGKVHDALPSGKLVISFFKDAINMLLEEGKIFEYTVIKGENDLILYKFIDADVFLMHGTIGCPACAGYLDELTGIGVDTVMFCGGGGVLDSSISVGELLVVEGAIRDEGFSYHYVAPSRIIYTDRGISDKIASYFDDNGIPYIKGITWTTDAFYRETRGKIAARKAEGAKIVEMEQSGCIAVSQFRGIKYGAVIYGGDDVSGDKWDRRAWNERKGIRYSLINICKELVELI